MPIFELQKNKTSDKPFLASRKLGQNFLINQQIQRKIVNCAMLKDNDYVLEIGPGLGAITGVLLSYKIKLTAIELDKRLFEYLQNKFSSYNNFYLINNDALTIEWNDFLAPNTIYKLVANLPYSISSSIVIKLLKYNQVNDAVILVQKEFANRLKAKVGTKNYNMFSVLVQLYFDVWNEFDISPNNFKPAPKVMSSLVHIKRKKELLVANEELDKISDFLRLCFRNKRKTLMNNLLQQHNKPHIIKVFFQNNLSYNIRAEQLTPQELVNLMQKLEKENG